MPRPKLDEAKKRGAALHVRCTPAQKNRVITCSKATNQTESKFISTLIDAYKFKTQELITELAHYILLKVDRSEDTHPFVVEFKYKGFTIFCDGSVTFTYYKELPHVVLSFSNDGFPVGMDENNKELKIDITETQVEREIESLM